VGYCLSPSGLWKQVLNTPSPDEPVFEWFGPTQLFAPLFLAGFGQNSNGISQNVT